MQYQNMDVFREHVDNLLERLYISTGKVDLQPLFFKFTLDTTTALLLGRSVYSLRAVDVNDTGNKDFAENFDIAQGGLAKRFRLAPWHFLYSPPQSRRSCSVVHQFIDEYISERGLDKEKKEKSWSSRSTSMPVERTFLAQTQMTSALSDGKSRKVLILTVGHTFLSTVARGRVLVKISHSWRFHILS